MSLIAPIQALAQSGEGEIVVTARKQTESIQLVPVAVTSLAGDELRSRGVLTALDLGRAVPNLVTANHPISPSMVTFAIRGQRSGDVTSTGDGTVGVYADGINVARVRGMGGAFFDLARVEVLKGPQGTLYGRNTTGGAVNIISRDADYKGIHGYIGADIGNYGLIAPRFAINLPLVDDMLTVRVAAQGTFRRGFGESVTTGQRIGQDRDQIIARATIIADPWEGVNLKAKAEFFRTKENGTLITPIGLLPNSLAATAVANQLGLANPGSPEAHAIVASVLGQQFVRGPGDYDRTFTEFPQHDDFEGHNFGLTATFDLAADVQFKSITGYREFYNKQAYDYDGTRFRLLGLGLGQYADTPLVQPIPGLPPTAFQTDPGPEQDNRFFSQEFNLSGTTLDGRLRWLGGFFFSREVARDAQIVQALPPIVSVANIVSARIVNSSWSIYTQEEFKISEKLSIQGGFRYTEERKSVNDRSRNFNPANNTITCSTGVPGTFPASNADACLINNDEVFTGTSWMGGVSYQANRDLLIYARVARGFKSGVLPVGRPLSTALPVNPEFAREIEVGIKSDWFDRRLRANLAAFHTDYTNKQEAIFVRAPSGATIFALQNAASATLRGFEGEFSARPVDALTLRANVAYLWGRYDSFPGAMPIVSGSPPVDASGERLSDPPWTYSLGARYETPVGAGTLGIQADWSWTAGANPPPRRVNPAYSNELLDRLVGLCIGSCTNGRASLGLLSGSVDYAVDSIGLKVSLFATNLLDKKYQIAGSDASIVGGLITAISTEPRMFGLQIRKSFGSE